VMLLISYDSWNRDTSIIQTHSCGSKVFHSCKLTKVFHLCKLTWIIRTILCSKHFMVSLLYRFHCKNISEDHTWVPFLDVFVHKHACVCVYEIARQQLSDEGIYVPLSNKVMITITDDLFSVWCLYSCYVACMMYLISHFNKNCS